MEGKCTKADGAHGFRLFACCSAGRGRLEPGPSLGQEKGGQIRGQHKGSGKELSEVHWMRVGRSQRRPAVFRGPAGAGDTVTRLSHFLVSSREHHLQDDASFILSKSLPRGPGVACWLMQSPWRLTLLPPPPSLFCLEALALCLRGLEEVDICFLYQSFVLWAPTLCRVEILGEGQPI